MQDYRDGKRYLSLNAHLKQTFGENVYKITIDAGFTCPNRDGTHGAGGCAYCYGARTTPEFIDLPTLRAQMDAGRAALHRKYHAHKFLAYFQSYTNTYAPIEYLAMLYRAALAEPEIVGLSIGTRPDCVPNEVLDLLGALAQTSYLWLEYGLQTIHAATLQAIRRGHDAATFRDAVQRTHARPNIKICAHVILGLPGETRAQMCETADALARLGVHGVKIHSAHVIKDTPWESMYQDGTFQPMELPEYVQTICDFLEHLAPDIVIHRLVGDAPRSRYIAPAWCLRKSDALRAIDAELERRNSWQGKNSCQAH